MPGKQAKTLSEPLVSEMLAAVAHSRTRERDQVMILLSCKAGLRACEIAGLEWSMLLDGAGNIEHALSVEDRIAKKGSGRRIPIHPKLRIALETLLHSTSNVGPVIRSARGGAMRPNSIVNWFVDLFRALELRGCSSHSGRRTFITVAARNIHHVGGSLRDVQILAGHRSLSVTQGYIDGDTDAQRRLVALL